jgi:hypothetical protein
MQDWSHLCVLATWQRSSSKPGPGMPASAGWLQDRPHSPRVRTMTRGYRSWWQGSALTYYLGGVCRSSGRIWRVAGQRELGAVASGAFYTDTVDNAQRAHPGQ